MRALVIGGTGPTGHFIVNGLRARGYAVTIFHSGRHELAEIPADVEHLHGDPFAPGALEAALGARSFDVCIATYGRLRRWPRRWWAAAGASSRSAACRPTAAS